MKRRLVVSCIVATFVVSASARAEITFQYVGNPLAEVLSGTDFTADDFLSGFVEFSSAPEPGGVFGESDIADYRFSAGPFTVDASRLDASIQVAEFTFDDGGDILYWYFSVFAGSEFGFITNRTDTPGEYDPLDMVASQTASAQNNDSPGDWAPVPEPPTLATWLLLGLMGSVVAWRSMWPKRRID